MKVYQGNWSDYDRQVVVIEDGMSAYLSPEPSQEIINHSPDGFNWGYGGSGPAQLALGLLLDVTGDRKVAQHHYQVLKFYAVAHFGLSILT